MQPNGLKNINPEQRRKGKPIHELVEGVYPPGLEGEVFVSSFTELLSEPNPLKLHPLILKWASISDSSHPKLLFLDTETTGLSGGTGTLAFMIGTGWIENHTFHTHQYFLTDPAYEPALLELLTQDISSFDTVVTFNGKSFDMNLLERRFMFHSFNYPFVSWGHIDLLHLSRRLWKRLLPGCSLQQLEVSLQLTRREGSTDIPGSLIPQVYFDYLRFGQTVRLQNVFYHNRIDVRSMHKLLNLASAALQYPYSIKDVNRPVMDPVAVAGMYRDMGEIHRAIEIYTYQLSKEVNDECLKNLSFIYKRLGKLQEARSLWEVSADRGDVIACIELAKLAEHREKNLLAALKWTEKAFSTLDDSHRQVFKLFDDLIHRRNRILKKITALRH